MGIPCYNFRYILSEKYNQLYRNNRVQAKGGLISIRGGRAWAGKIADVCAMLTDPTRIAEDRGDGGRSKELETGKEEPQSCKKNATGRDGDGDGMVRLNEKTKRHKRMGVDGGWSGNNWNCNGN